MKPKQVYLEAGRCIAEREYHYSCFAIKHAVLGQYSFGSYMDVPIARDYPQVFGFPNAWQFQMAIDEESETSRDLRVWLLCLAAAMQD